MRLCILGPLEIDDDTLGRRIAVTGLKRPALLATLIVRAGRTVSIERLVQELWGEDPPANAVNALQAHIKRLRRLIGPDRIATSAPGYRLTAGPGGTDAELFTAQVKAARTVAASDPGSAVPLLREALALWRGPALDGCVSGDICRAEAVVLEESRLAAMETLYDASLRAGRPEEIIGELEETLAAYPLRERVYGQLMVALSRAGRQSEAIGVYDRARRRLLEDLGVEPGPALRATLQSVLADSVPASPAELGAELAALQRRIEELTRQLRTLNAS